jgi:hypothetical protein
VGCCVDRPTGLAAQYQDGSGVAATEPLPGQERLSFRSIRYRHVATV